MSKEIHALLASRICHDLISPVGAIGNGLEMAKISPSPELDLITLGSDMARAKLEFYRVAFGAGDGASSMPPEKLARIGQDYFRESRYTLSFDAIGLEDRADIRLHFLILMAMETALPFGGDLLLRAGFISGTGRRVKTELPVWKMLDGGEMPEDIRAGDVHIVLLAQELEKQNKRLEISADDTQITLRVEPQRARAVA
ncbi:histidine phosphotransferase family protein [Paracoccaceae bacterium GXU_MW_L88]